MTVPLARPEPPPTVLRPTEAELAYLLPGFPSKPRTDPIPPDARCTTCGGRAGPLHPLLRFLDGHLAHDWCPPPGARAAAPVGMA